MEVVAWKIDKKMGIVQMMIFEKKNEEGWKMSVTWFSVWGSCDFGVETSGFAIRAVVTLLQLPDFLNSDG